MFYHPGWFFVTPGDVLLPGVMFITPGYVLSPRGDVLSPRGDFFHHPGWYLFSFLLTFIGTARAHASSALEEDVVARRLVRCLAKKVAAFYVLLPWSDDAPLNPSVRGLLTIYTCIRLVSIGNSSKFERGQPLCFVFCFLLFLHVYRGFCFYVFVSFLKADIWSNPLTPDEFVII